MHSIFSIDVEEWFHILETDFLDQDHQQWKNYPSRIENIFNSMLDMLDEGQVKATLFFLGWIAEQYPDLVLEAHKRGHEIAAHGYYHKLVSNQTYHDFYAEMANTKRILEDICGQPVTGFRAPGFSITSKTVWAYKALIDLGFKYSSSVYPAKRSHGHYSDFGIDPKIISYDNKEIIEFPMTILKFPFTFLSCFGGGYFRLFPHLWYTIASGIVKSQKRHVIFYIHPRDIDAGQPKFNMPFHRMIKCYINIESAENKMKKVLSNGGFILFRDACMDINAGNHKTEILNFPEHWSNAFLKEQRIAG